jgi:transketolase
MRKGGYVVYETETPAITLVANGSEVSLLCEVAELLKAEGIGCRVVSVPSLGLFNRQPKAYREGVIPANLPVFGLTAGLPSTLRSVVGQNGEVYGLDHFGASAPYKVLDEKFGFTAAAVLARVKALL